jgi:hypothetical protein
LTNTFLCCNIKILKESSPKVPETLIGKGKTPVFEKLGEDEDKAQVSEELR